MKCHESQEIREQLLVRAAEAEGWLSDADLTDNEHLVMEKAANVIGLFRCDWDSNPKRWLLTDLGWAQAWGLRARQ